MQAQAITGFQLAPQQKRLWNLQQNSSAFYCQCSIVIKGNLQPDILQTAIEQVVNHHDILRTNFSCLPGIKHPVMVVAERSGFNWEYLDLSDCLQSDIDSKIQELFWVSRQEYQNLSQGYPLSLSLVKVSQEQHILIITLPSLCADTRTIKNLVNQISQAYAQCYQGKEFNQEYLQYVQFSEWQNQLLVDEDAETAKEYWEQQKNSYLSTLKLPGERQGNNQPFITDKLQLNFNKELTEAIFNYSHKHQTSVDIILLACWQILIWRLTGESEIVIGTASERREYEELDDTLGLLATWLPIKTNFISNSTSNFNFIEVLAAVIKTLEKAGEWQDYFVPEAVKVDSSIVFPIGFEFLNITENKFDSPEVSFRLQEIYSFIEPFKVKLTCLQSNDSLIAEFSYNLNYFSQETIQQLTTNFQTLLNNIIDYPEIPVSQLGIISANERHKLLIEFNQTKADYEGNKCIHQLFEEQVEKTPDTVAVVFDNEEITYKELNSQANQLAHHLQKLGVKPEEIIGICVERSPKFIISILAVLKAGGAYLPLDSNLPYEALQFRLQNAQASILIKEQKVGNGEQFSNIKEVNLDTDGEIIAQESTDNLVSNVQLENLVYVIYTSGSTGKPKGVAVEHQQLLNYLYGILPKLQLPANATYASVSTFTADLGNTVIFPCLCSGGCLHVISWEHASDPPALATYFRHHPIDCLKIVPSHLAALLTSQCWEILPRQLLILGGEAADWNLIENIKRNAPHCRILNHYGPTETTVGVLTYSVGERIEETATVPIGKPIANTQVYVLDAQLQPIPLGVAGELYIGGKSLARGYLNHPELTNNKFINNPFSDTQQRLYKTGDRVRYLWDGNIEFIGRLDDQVKIRGYRIELGEICATLNQHPGVRESIVITREDIPGEKRLVAYVVPSNHTPDIDFCNFLKTKLPEYMIPASVVILKALPLTINGKLDRNALPIPEEVISRKKTFIAPRTPVEEVLAGIWTQLLGVARVSIADNFFDLGGHSLLATQVISRIRTSFGVEIPLPKLFASADLAALATQIEIEMRGGKQVIGTIFPVSRDKNLPLSFAQQRLWFFDQFEPGSPSYNLPRAVRLRGKININALANSLKEIIRRHEIFRTSFGTYNGQPIQIISDYIDFKLPVIDLQNFAQEKRELELYRLIKEEAKTGFDLTKAPLLRGKLLQLDAEEYVILLTLHHIISDGWSTDILIREIATLYSSYCTVRLSRLPKLPIQYADFAFWQRQWLEGEALQNQLAYWQQQLSGELPILQLPTDRPRPTVQTYAGKTLSFVLPETLSEGLKALSKQEGVTLFMTLLAGFKTLLYRYTNQTDIIVGSPIANRNRAEIENLIGFFVNTLVLRSDLSGNPSFRDLLKQIREVALGAYTHQDLPFEKLVEEIQPERNLSHNPLFQVMFVLQNPVKEKLDLPGLKVEPLTSNSTTAKFDLTLVMEDVEEGLIAHFEYNTDLFEEITVSRLAANFAVLLQGIVAKPEQQLAELPILTTTEEQQLLDWSQGETKQLPELCLHKLFEVQVEKTPDEIAVVFADQSLTYREINQRANQLAHYLQKLGVKPEVLVGICVERSLEMVIGLLGIIKAGGAYIPIDSAYPQKRIEGMLTDSQLSVLVTQSFLLEHLAPHNTQVVCLDIEWEKISQESNENPHNRVTPENLAYVIYTSGSTGKPKGVEICHGAVVNFLMTMQKTPGLTQKDIFLAVTTLSFDIAALEIYLPLIVGAKVVIVSREEAFDGVQLSNKIASCGATIMQATPATWRMLLSAGWRGNQKLKILCGGEVLDYKLAQELQQRSQEVWNLYGPTETTIWSAVSCVENRINIGHPITNTQFYILDSNNKLVPIGVPGELHIGGAGLARGYLHQPQLTAQKFISNPFHPDSTSRLYKTGDLVRYCSDGTIEFLGRIDHQVKIRSFRIELGEIESVLNQYPDVQANLVVVREDKPGNQRLVAYIVSKSQQEIKNTEILNFLQDKLPTYMLPTAFVILDKLPLTPNGKIDRKALPIPEIGLEINQQNVLPRTPIEKQVAKIWAGVLGLEQVGIYDNFFTLGGHSLLATQVISQIRQVLQVELPIRRLFEFPTIASFSQEITQTQKLTSIPKPRARARHRIKLSSVQSESHNLQQ
ncbi:MAG: amino acid adenylation domain-containing protein [Nostocaceae cyanobacterium]|nr:amino acid adenylation domain-containing protein [Nostocaceae cyanobacterium]